MYVKIFPSIYRGTMYGQLGPQVVFIYLLAHADADGNVTASPQSIAGDTGLGLDLVMRAFEVLEGEDLNSTTPTEGGRRIIRAGTSWTWSIVNYLHYRSLRNDNDRRHQTLEAVHRHRANKKAAVSQGKPRKAKVSQGKPRKAQGEGEGEGEGLEPTPLLNEVERGLLEGWVGAFEKDFWKLYPRKVGRVAAERAWAKIRPKRADQAAHEELLGRICDALEDDMEQEWAARESDKIPHAATWLNQRRFDDRP